MWTTLFLLLPLAALSGWYLARKQYKSRISSPINPAYFKGLNYLLDEQPDKAIDVFIGLLEVNPDTVETHLALANLFRRRGEADRAIRIHQNLIARPTLNPQQRSQALLELGLDYMHAGVLDRAEQLFLEVLEQSHPPNEAPRQLMRIYQQEKKWLEAIAMAKRLEPNGKLDTRQLIAQFYCELAKPLQKHDATQALRHLKHAHQYDGNCVRASLLEGEILSQLGQHKKAITVLTRIEQQDPQFITEALPILQQCHEQLNSLEIFQGWLETLLQRYPQMTSVRLLLATLIQKREGYENAQRYLYKSVQQYPSVEGLHALIELGDARHHDLMPLIRNVTSALVMKGDRYNCSQCGFAGRTLYWQCPGCGQWATLQPIEIHLSELEKLLETR
jgi:lipopolysaccharide biosynthesis regulator YciM